MLGRKQATPQARWLATVDRIDRLVSRAAVDALAERTVEAIAGLARGRRAAFGWSGGKDSLVLQALCERAGVAECAMGLTDLEYPAFLGWVTDHMPVGLELVHTGQDLSWLAAHQDLLFPPDGAAAARWFALVQHAAQRRYARANRLELLLLGRRRLEGNCARPDGRALPGAPGCAVANPLWDWAHEDILAYLHHHAIALPPIYGWPDGFRVGTGPWPARQWTGGVRQGWRAVYAIDPAVVREAAAALPSARAFLDEEAA